MFAVFAKGGINRVGPLLSRYTIQGLEKYAPVSQKPNNRTGILKSDPNLVFRAVSFIIALPFPDGRER